MADSDEEKDTNWDVVHYAVMLREDDPTLSLEDAGEQARRIAGDGITPSLQGRADAYAGMISAAGGGCALPARRN